MNPVGSSTSGLLILTYHGIGRPRCMEPSLYVSEQHFERQVGYLVRHYRPVSLEKAVELMGQGDPLPDKSVALTFDDGYRDNYEKAFPILKRYGCPATMFVATEPLETGKALWPNRLYFWLMTTEASELRLCLNSSEGPRSFKLRTARQRKTIFYAIKPALMHFDPLRRDALVRGIAESLGFGEANDPLDQAAMLTWDQLREMAAAGIGIGSHTMTHPVLTTLRPEEVTDEVTRSKALLEGELQRPVTLFAYPFGERDHFNEDIETTVKRAGYRAACSALEGINLPGMNRFALLRIHIRNRPTPIFALRLCRAAHAPR